MAGISKTFRVAWIVTEVGNTAKELSSTKKKVKENCKRNEQTL